MKIPEEPLLNIKTEIASSEEKEEGTPDLNQR